MAPPMVRNHLSTIRKSRGIGAAELARRAGVSRQTIYSIEAGTYIPNTEVTLHLARELEVTVEELFHLDAAPRAPRPAMPSDLLTTRPVRVGQPVRVCQVGEKLISVPTTAEPYFLPDADGTISQLPGPGRAAVELFAPEETFAKRLILAGCDPAMQLLARMVEKTCGVEIVACGVSSQQALQWLKEGRVHIAGTHLEDSATGEFNLPFVARELPGDDCTVVTFARWEEGFVMAPGNPLSIRSAADLARRGVRLINREPGSGARQLLDKLLAEAGVMSRQVNGYQTLAHGHLAAAYSVRAGAADVCLATGSAAHAFGLSFLPVRSARYDLVMRRALLDTPAAQAFLDVLQRASLRRQLEALAGYDTAQTGVLLA
ncbi:MAG: helix-turn-helix domain-containing protein [Acidobacteria bacterium]|nr:helix-turn-helix domain-containing protein [Acidobacteriota bacterium]